MSSYLSYEVCFGSGGSYFRLKNGKLVFLDLDQISRKIKTCESIQEQPDSCLLQAQAELTQPNRFAGVMRPEHFP